MFKKLPTDADGLITNFETARFKYIVIKPGQPIGIARWTEYEKLKITMGFGKTFSQLVDGLRSLQNRWADDRPAKDIRKDAIIELESLIRSVVEMSKARYNIGFYLASIFIVREGDSPLKWDVETATRDIQDWQEYGLDESQLFFFASKTVPALKEKAQVIRAAIEQEVETLAGLSAGIGSKGKAEYE